MMDLHDTLNDLEKRINEPAQNSASGRLTTGILNEVNAATPLQCDAREFNTGAERYYRTTLRQRHLEEALGFMEQDCDALNREQAALEEDQRKALRVILPGEDAARFVRDATQDVLHERADVATLKRLMNLVLFTTHHDALTEVKPTAKQRSNQYDATSIYRAG
jgi:hypothetical protein